MKIAQIKTALSNIRSSGLSMKRRLAVYTVVLLCLFLAFIGITLNLLGILNFTPDRIQDAFTHELEETNLRFENDMDLNAARAISFAEQLSAVTEHYLDRRNLNFEDLKNNISLIDELQLELYNIVGANMRYSNCSGAFFMLDTTVNSSMTEKYHSGIYLKFSYLRSQSMINHQISMLYGSSAISKEYGVDYYSSWHLEMPEGVYSEIDELFSASKSDMEDTYILTSVYSIPETWENVRFLCVPVFNERDRLIGVCGFEISSLYFSLSYNSHNPELENIVHGLFSETADGSFVGQISGNHSGYSPSAEGVLSIKDGKNIDTFTYGSETFAGKKSELTLGASTLVSAVMVPEYIYENLLLRSYFRMAAILLSIILLIILVCLYFSHKYMKPILKSLEHIKSNSAKDMQIKIPEIDDLFRFLADKDKGHEDEILRLTQLRDEAKEEYTRLQLQLEKVINRHKSSVDPEFYEIFKTNVHKLTSKEKEIFRMYLDGKTAKEIQDTLEINPNTLKYHNKNIYGKLGVTNRKELLLYAAMLKQEEFYK